MLLATGLTTSDASADSRKRDQDGYILGGYGDNDPGIFRPSKGGFQAKEVPFVRSDGKRDQDGYILGGYGDNDPGIFRPSRMK